MARLRNYYPDHAPRHSSGVDPYYENYQHNRQQAFIPQQAAPSPVMVVQKDAHPEMRLVLAAVLAFTVSPAVGGLYFAMSAANTIVNAIDHTVQQRRAYENAHLQNTKQQPEQLPDRFGGSKVLSMVPLQQGNLTGRRIEGKEIEEVVRSLESARSNGETHVGIPMRKHADAMENVASSTDSNNPGNRKANMLEQAPYSEWLVIKPIEPLIAALKKVAEAGMPLQTQVSADVKQIPEVASEQKNTVKEAVQQQIEIQNAALREMVAKWQDAGDKKGLTATESLPSLFGGKVALENVPAIKQHLDIEKQEGNRFVTYPVATQQLHVSDFTLHKDAFSALDHQYERSKLNERVEMRSVEVILRELDKLLITEKEKGHSNVMGQTNVQKRPRSMELEC